MIFIEVKWSFSVLADYIKEEEVLMYSLCKIVMLEQTSGIDLHSYDGKFYEWACDAQTTVYRVQTVIQIKFLRASVATYFKCQAQRITIVVMSSITETPEMENFSWIITNSIYA